MAPGSTAEISPLGQPSCCCFGVFAEYMRGLTANAPARENDLPL